MKEKQVKDTKKKQGKQALLNQSSSKKTKSSKNASSKPSYKNQDSKQKGVKTKKQNQTQMIIRESIGDSK